MIANPSLATYFTGVAPGDLYSTNFYENLDIRVYYFFLYPGLTWADKNQSNLNWTGYDMIGNPHAGWTVRCLKD
ncbi:hypothetical protein COX68_02510 [Candidatus Falkowbacteria bacterium CG_4_10_14_0_2_um_filter_41_15]|uniref:Uncharacterized protein n=1 Tax=Candidatus Falkowbacteria bacterium CG_4_10_14_0_2_um_filter_41_15 TaxID=1974554 RepID=A0A2M7VYB5_9BACT|nr:MAG: hypothetical protein COX68_02510 [Candidatus Falkowbacteria bacterium CG_4_10_14_0_2_um_filter_41_15]